MQDVNRARQVVFRAIDAVNANLSPNERIEKAGSTLLLDEKGCLDSLTFVELAMQIQELVLDEYGVPISVAGEGILGSSHSPFRTVDSLASHLAELLEREQAA
jgi:acyl carrier protein